MLPHSLTKKVVGSTRPTYMEPGNRQDVSSENYDFFNTESDIILEDEEEYDILNNETFGGSKPAAVPAEEDESIAWDDNYDLHNDETFGGEIEEYDWEAEHEKLVNIIGHTPESSKDDIEQSHGITDEKSFILSPDIIKKNGYHKSNVTPKKNVYNETDSHKLNSIRNQKDEEPFKFPPVVINDAESSSNEYESHLDYSYNEAFEHIEERDEFGSNETLTNDFNRDQKHDKWYNSNFDHSSGGPNRNSCDFSQGYSLFSSGTNLLQNAGIHIPSVSTSSAISKPVDALESKFDSMKLQPSTSKIPSVADLEKQWINESASSSKSIINADCFRAYNSALFLNGNHTSNDTSQPSVQKSSQPEHMRLVNDGFPNFINQQKAPDQIKAPLMQFRVEENDKNIPKKFNVYDPQTPEMATLFYRNTINYANLNANILNSYTNTMILPVDAAKGFPLVDLAKEPPMLIPNEAPTHITESTTILLENARTNPIPGLDRIHLGMFPPPPPGLTIDPSKMCHVPAVPSVAAVALRPAPAPAQPSSYLTLPPPQVLNRITTIEQQKQLMKMQNESDVANLSNIDEYAGMMTEREKYWLAGVQLLQINSMDPYKDDYYFTNFQARRKGNRNKNQNTNNPAWKNNHTKDYSPLQFENSLGRVQIGSVVAPRQVIDTYLIESSPKTNANMEDIIQEDTLANTSNRKRKALMLQIENMYSKIIALEGLHMNNGKNKPDPDEIKLESMSIAAVLREEILNMKDDFKIIMSIKKGKRLVLRFLSFCDNPGEVWFEIFKILDRVVRSDQEHGLLLSYLPYFRAWLTTTQLTTLILIANHFQKNLNLYLRDKFCVSVIANMIEQAEQIFLLSKPEEQNAWMDFVISLAEIAHTSFDFIQKPVVSVKPQILRSHLLKCKKLENGYMSCLLKIFSNNTRK
ncbi:uncharacterized protein Patr-1 [Planococcus citri]|uniref:uncharacterized protein Patr-1 n=1 Tax=Planococcus citri TaxID=170843 RepID=UPI0031F8DBA1